MKKLRNFYCPNCDQDYERLAKDNELTKSCLECDKETKRTISAGKYLGNTVGKSPSL